QEIIPDESGKVKAVITRSGDMLPCQFGGLATGVKPNISFLNNTDIESDKGILVDHHFKTSQDAVYAIGDCAKLREPAVNSPAIEQLWYTARLHGEALAANLPGSPNPYNRGPWFNSAKFLDVEFQTYGYVPVAPGSNGYQSIYWQHPSEAKAIRIV